MNQMEDGSQIGRGLKKYQTSSAADINPQHPYIHSKSNQRRQGGASTEPRNKLS